MKTKEGKTRDMDCMRDELRAEVGLDIDVEVGLLVGKEKVV